MNKKLILFLSLFLSVTAFSQVRMNYKEIYKEAAPGVVLLFGAEGKVGSTGSGSIIKEDGTILTNAHVVINPNTHKPYSYLSAFMKPERVNGKNVNDLKHEQKVVVLAFDEEVDLAVVKMVTPPASLVTIPIADSQDVGIGESTVAIGHPEQGSRWSLTTGAIGGEIDDLNGVQGNHVFQMETSVNKGNSGGPLLDYRGYLIGVNSLIARESSDGLAIVGINFAIKSNAAVSWLAKNNVSINLVKNDGKVVTPVVEQKVAVASVATPVVADAKQVQAETITNADLNTAKTETKTETKTTAKEEKVVAKVTLREKKSANKEMKLKLVVHDENKTQTTRTKKRQKIRKKQKISNVVVFRIVKMPKKKYKTRPHKVKVKGAKSGFVFTEFKLLNKRSKKAHKKLNDKLGSWEDDEIPGWDDEEF